MREESGPLKQRYIYTTDDAPIILFHSASRESEQQPTQPLPDLGNPKGKGDFLSNGSTTPELKSLCPFSPLCQKKAPYIHVNTLTIYDVRAFDFGNYTCFARSSVESAREVVSLQSKQKKSECRRGEKAKKNPGINDRLAASAQGCTCPRPPLPRRRRRRRRPRRRRCHRPRGRGGRRGGRGRGTGGSRGSSTARTKT